MFTQQFILFTALYWLFSFFVVIPPFELRAAGLCTDYLFANFLGNEMRDFVSYQMRRTSLNILLHSCLPLGYYFCGVLCTDYFYKALTPTAVYVWAVYVTISQICALLGVTLFVYRYVKNYANHPVAIALKYQASGTSLASSELVHSATVSSTSSDGNNTSSSSQDQASHDASQASNRRVQSSQNTSNARGRGSDRLPAGILWTTVANSINAEMLTQGDKFCSGPYTCRIYVTQNWLIQTGIYSTNIVHKSDIHLVLNSKQELQFTTESRFSQEYVTIEVHSINQTAKPFIMHLKTPEYHELRERLAAPVVNARNIVLSQSISERFMIAFQNCAAENDKYQSFTEQGKPCDTLVELCIGCNVSVSDVKLVKFCDPRDCGNCFCRPMWCVTCLSKWFAARQDQTNPHTWLQGTAPCPTCRSKFCMLDVCLIARPVENASDEQ